MYYNQRTKGRKMSIRSNKIVLRLPFYPSQSATFLLNKVMKLKLKLKKKTNKNP